MKKTLLIIGILAAMAGGVVGMSAFEAHVINVTATIENALSVWPGDEIKFGTVFPQELIFAPISIGLSESFINSEAKSVDYTIKRKTKPTPALLSYFNDDQNQASGWCEQNGPEALVPGTSEVGCYATICDYLFTHIIDEPLDGNDTDRWSAYRDNTFEYPYLYESRGDAFCWHGDPDSIGKLDKTVNDIQDLWHTGMIVPPIKGYIGQDWPKSCIDQGYYVLEDSQNYGCDLSIEVTGIQR